MVAKSKIEELYSRSIDSSVSDGSSFASDSEDNKISLGGRA
jgi:hypothetical protein